MDWDLSVLKEFSETNFSSVSNRDIVGFVVHFNSDVRVVENALFDEFDHVVLKFTVQKSVVS